MDTEEENNKKPSINYKKYFFFFITITLIICGFFLLKRYRNNSEKQIEKTKPIINFENNTITLTESFKNDLINANNPKIILCIGETRTGKSTLLNNIILDKRDFWFDKNPFIYQTPFYSGGGTKKITKSFNYYGPISNKELLYRNNFHFSENETELEEFDLFFIDSEGVFSFEGDFDHLFHGIFALQSISSYILYVINSVPNSNNLETIKNELTVFDLLNERIGFNLPELIIVANKIEHDDNFKDLSYEEKENQTFYDNEYIINEYLNEILNQNLNFHYIIQWNLGHQSTIEDFNFYWKTIEKITEIISKKSKNKAKKNDKNLMYNFESTINIIKKIGLSYSTNFRNSDEIFNIFIRYILDEISEEEKKAQNKIYEILINETINKVTDDDFIKTGLNNEKIIALIHNFEQECKKIIKEKIILKFFSLKNKKDKLEYLVNKIYISIFEIFIKKMIERLKEINNEWGRKETELLKKIEELESEIERLIGEKEKIDPPFPRFTIPIPDPHCSIF